MTEKWSILIVDDNEDLANNLQDILHEKGYLAALAKDGASATEICERQSFDLVLLDYNLPDMNGLQLQEKLSETIQADYIVVTGYASVESASEAVSRKQIVGYETKPIDMDRLLSFIEQIRERRQAEEELRKSRERYRNLYEAITDALFVHVVEEDGAMSRFSEVNDVACQRYGYSREEFLGLSPCDIDAPESNTDVASIVRKLARGQNVTFEQIHLAKSGRRIPVEIHAKTFKLDGNPSVLSLVRDIADRKQAEEERRRMERRLQMLQRLESLGVMAGGIAHDFNNILMVVIGNIEMAMLDEVQSLETLSNLEESKKAALRATDLVRQMIAYTGKGMFSVASVFINSIAEETVELMKAKVSPKAELKTNLDGENPVIEGDEAQLRQIASNLIGNACEALDEKEGGSVVVSTGIERCDASLLKQTMPEAWLIYPEPWKEGNYAFLEVRDDGCGMDADVQKRIFDPFFTTKFQGRGLGLSAVIGMVRSHKGFVRVDSTPGQGTAVRILFPLQGKGMPRTDAETSSETAKITWRGEGLVLLAHDEEAVRNIMRRMMEKMGYAAMVASNGLETVGLYRRHADEIVLIIMDWRMSPMGGVETFRELRRIGCSAPVILASGYSEEKVREQLDATGFSGFIRKPFQMKTLMELLARIMPKGKR